MDMSQMAKMKMNKSGEEYSAGDKVTCTCKCTVHKNPDGSTSIQCNEMDIESDNEGEMDEGFDEGLTKDKED